MLFLAVLVLSLALLLGIMLGNYKRSYRNARSDVIELSKSSSARNAESIEMFFTRHEDVLLATAEMVEYALDSEDIEIDEVETLLHNMSVAYNESIYKKTTGKEFTGIYAAVDGVLLHGLKTAADLPEGYDPLKRQWYTEGRQGGGEVVFGEPYYDVYDPTVLVMTATKLLSDGETVVGMDITLEDMQSAGGDMDVTVTLNGERHDYGHGFIVTDRGIVMAHWIESEQGKNYSDPSSPRYEVFQRLKECADGNEDYLEMDVGGVTYGIFPQKLNNGWYVVTFTDLEEIRTTISESSKVSLLGTVIVTLVALTYCILISRAYFKAETLTQELRNALDMAKRDVLTGYSNRTAYDIHVRELKERLHTPDDAPFALIMMDLNDLKYINDRYGHSAGDRYICNSCELVLSVVPGDLYRIGGDEFALFIEGELFEGWERLFYRLRQTVAPANLALVPSVEEPSVAIGLAVHEPGRDDDLEAVIRKADADMYSDKAAIKRARLEHSEKGGTPDVKHEAPDKQS